MALHRFPSKLSSLDVLKASNMPVSTILDIGVNQQTYELIKAFPDKKQLLFEPVSEFNSTISDNYKDIDYELFNVALSDVSDSAFLELICFTDHQKVTHSRVNFDGTHNQSEDTREINTITLDDFMIDKDYEKPYLLKIDVDFGNDIKILKGASNTLKNVSCVIIEASVDKLHEEIKFLYEQGFHLWDVVDLCYFWNTLNQVDLIFLNYSLWPNPQFYPEHLENPWDPKIIIDNYHQLLDTDNTVEYKNEISDLKNELQQLSANSSMLNSKVQQYEEHIQILQNEIETRDAIRINETSDLKLELQQLSANSSMLNSKVQQYEEHIQILQNEIRAMKTSKFWKMRDVWFSFKRLGRF